MSLFASLRQRLAAGSRLRAASDSWRRRWYGVPFVRRRLAQRALRGWHGGTLAFVCLGNICRSPFAERLANQRLDGTQRVLSAGYFPEKGRRSPATAIDVARKLGVDLAGHRSRVLDEGIVRDADAIFVFDADNHRRVRAYPGARRKLHFMGSLAPDGPLFIADPYGGSARDYEVTYRRIEALIERATGSAGRHPA
jgi:protein-tyrosine-phosphatase